MTKCKLRVVLPPLSPITEGFLLDTNDTVVQLKPKVLQELLARLEEVSAVTYGSEVITLRIMGGGDTFEYEVTAQYTASGTSY